MPITVEDELPAIARLRHENVFVMPKTRAKTQEIRPMRLAILNLMPNKVETEVQFIRLLANSPLQVNVELLRLDTHRSSSNSEQHLDTFYRYFSEVFLSITSLEIHLRFLISRDNGSQNLSSKTFFPTILLEH